MRILVVEDEKRIAQAIKRTLEMHNFAVDLVYDSENGLSYGGDSDYDLIVLDRMLPGKFDGLYIAKELRKDKVTTPILMLTALSQTEEKIDGLKNGADDYLTKPFSMEELVVRVQVLLRRPHSSNGPELKVDDLTLNTESFAVQRSGQSIKLTSTEFKLLSYLMSNQGQIVTKERIINHVWDGDSLIVPNTVEVYIGYLRKKIDRSFPGHNALIHTVHGFGYQIGKKK